MCQLQAGDDVANRVDTLNIGAQAFICEHEAALHVDTLLLVTEVCSGRAAPDGYQQNVAVVGVTVIRLYVNTGLILSDGFEHGLGLEVNATLAELALKVLRDGLIFSRNESVQALNDGYFSAEGCPYGRELNANDAAAKHDCLRRNPGHLQGLLGSNHVTFDFEAGNGLGVGAGGQDNVLAAVFLAIYGNGVLSREPAPALHVVDLAHLNEALQTLVELVNGLVTVFCDAVHVDSVEVRIHAKVGGFLNCVGNFCCVQVCLCRNATAVQAGAAKLVAFD